jgi:hypothetical protein
MHFFLGTLLWLCLSIVSKLLIMQSSLVRTCRLDNSCRGDVHVLRCFICVVVNHFALVDMRAVFSLLVQDELDVVLRDD